MNLKHFSQAEVEGLVEPLPEMLEEARDLLGRPIQITFTTGGKHCPHSTHYKGLAADIGLGHLDEGVERDHYRWALCQALFQAGFRRIELANLHFHVDLGQPPEYPSPILWLGEDS